MTKANHDSFSNLKWTGDTIFDSEVVNRDELWLESVIDMTFGRGTILDGFWLQGLYLVWCNKGVTIIETDDHQRVTLNAGDFTLLYPGHIINFIGGDTDNTATRLIITGSKAVQFADSLGFFDCFSGKSPAYHRNLKFIKDAKNETAKANGTALNAKNAVVMRLIRNLLVLTRETIRRQGNPLFYDAVQLFNADLETGAILVKQVAKILQVSPNTLHLAFAKSAFTSPGEYIAHRQLLLAQTLLRDTRLPINKVAIRCGFQTAAHFTVFIKRRTGKLPSAIRQHR